MDHDAVVAACANLADLELAGCDEARLESYIHDVIETLSPRDYVECVKACVRACDVRDFRDVCERLKLGDGVLSLPIVHTIVKTYASSDEITKICDQLPLLMNDYWENSYKTVTVIQDVDACKFVEGMFSDIAWMRTVDGLLQGAKSTPQPPCSSPSRDLSGLLEKLINMKGPHASLTHIKASRDGMEAEFDINARGRPAKDVVAMTAIDYMSLRSFYIRDNVLSISLSVS